MHTVAIYILFNYKNIINYHYIYIHPVCVYIYIYIYIRIYNIDIKQPCISHIYNIILFLLIIEKL